MLNNSWINENFINKDIQKILMIVMDPIENYSNSQNSL